MSDFIMQIGADLDLTKVQEQLNSIKSQKVTLDVEIKGNDDAKNLAKSIEKGLKATKLDTSNISKQIADSFNITDKSAINKIKSQINSIMSDLGKTWNGKEFNIQGNNGKAFISGLSDLANSVSENANIIQGKMGIYDEFYNYFKNKKIYISDDLKKAMSGDEYKELLNNNIGHIVRDATKGVSIDSIWSEMTSMFPEHFADNITNQADQIKKAFEVLAQARQDMTQVISSQDMSPEQVAGIRSDAFDRVIEMANQMKEKLQQNINTAAEGAKNTFDLDIEVNTEKIVSDIRNAIQSATSGTEDSVKINVKINDEELLSQMKSAINQLSTGDEPVKVDIQIDKQSLESDLEAALKDVELPIKFKIDADELKADIQAAVDSITDVEFNLRINADSVQSSVESAIDNTVSNTMRTPEVDTSGMIEMQNILNGLNAAGVQGQSVFQSFGNTLKEVGATFTVFNFLTDAIYKVGDAAKEAVSTVKELDNSIVVLQLATGKNYNTVSNMMKDYVSLGAELGTVGTAVAEGADAWLRQGKSIEEVNNLVKSSVIFSKVGDMSAEDATKYLTASLNGYNLEAEKAMSVVDKISNVDLNAAVSSSGLAEAMSRVAVVADQAGISMDKLLGYLATVGEVSQQSMSTVGTAMKSILTRMTNIKAGKLELVDEDGTTEKLSDVETTLANVGINLRKTMTEYNNASDVLDALAAKWDTLNQAQQNAIAISFGGQRMQNQFRILMQYYDRVQKYTDVAANSDGQGEQKFDLYLEGLEAKTNSLKASLESLSSSVISRDLYAGFLDGSKAVVDFTEKTGLLKGALAGLGTAGAVYAIQQIVSMATSATKEFSNLSNALKMVKAAESAGTFDTSNMSNLINLTKGLSEFQTKLVLSSTALSDAQRIAVLMSQGMTESQASAAVASMGLASAEGVATGATVTLSSAFSGLLATLAANPLILIAVGVTAAVTAFNSYKRSIEEAVDKAQEAGSTWEDSNTSLQENIDKIIELRTALDNGTLSEEEAYQAKSDLLEIQDSLTESYGSQAEGIDLVTGALDSQISKLKELSVEESKRFLNENKKGIDEAQKQVEKNRHTYLGQFYDNGLAESNDIKSALLQLQKKYGEEVFDLQNTADGMGTVNIQFNADASTAKDALNDFMNEMEQVQKKYGESDFVNNMLSNASAGLSSAKDVLDEYGDLYNQAKQAELFSDSKTYSGKTALEWLNNYEKAVKGYNDAISGGNKEEIASAKAYYDDINKSVQVLMNTDASKYSSQFKEIGDQLNTAAIKANEFNEALSGEGTNGYQKHLQSVAEEIKSLDMDDADFKVAVAKGDVDSINYLVQAAEQAGIISGTSANEIQPLITALGNLGYISNMSAEGLDNVADSADNVEMSFSDLAKENSSKLLQEINSVQSAIDSQSIGVSISYDDFSSDALADYRSALTNVNGAMQLNTDIVKKLTKAKVEEQVATNNTAKAQKQQEYLQNAKQIEALRQKLLNTTDATGKSAETIQNQIDGLRASNLEIAEQCGQLDVLNSSFLESIGIYQQWKEAQSAGEAGDMFDDTISAMQLISDTLNNPESDSYGRIGREDYKTSLDLVIPDTVDKTDEDAINSYMSSIEGLFKHNESGERIGLDVQELCQQAMDKGLMVLDESGENYQVAGGKTMEDFVEGMNLAMPMVQAMFGEMQELCATWDWSDEAVQTMGDLAVAATEASEAIRDIEGNDDLHIQLDVSDLKTTEEKCSALDQTISEMNDIKAKVGVDSTEVDQANTVIQYCVAQKQQLTAPAVMNVDTSMVEGKIGEAIELLQEFQTAQNNLEMQESLGMDTTEAQANVDAVAEKIKGLDTNVKATLSIDDSSIDTIQDSINSKLTNEVMIKAGIDDTAIIGFQKEDHDAKGKVKWDNDTSKVDAYANSEKISTGKVAWYNDETFVKKEFTATGKINWTNTKPTAQSGSHGVNGTAHTSGTAMASGTNKKSGDWGNKNPGTTLVGELGREMVVDPHTGRWYTVGNTGAEFQDIPKGAIVFNHLQTEELLSKGFVASRAVALASGTHPDISGKALVSGEAMVTGGISVKQAQKVSSANNYPVSSTANTTAQNKDTSAVQSHTDATNEDTKATKKSIKTFDWVAIRLEVWEQKVQAVADSITDFVSKTFKTRQLMRQMHLINGQISSNQKGTQTYMDKANSVAQNYTYYTSDGGEIQVTIPEEYKKLVQLGEYKIEDMDTTTDQGKALAEAIDQYQSYYEKAKDCEQAVIDLQNQQMELFDQWTNMPTEIAEKRLERLNKGFTGLEATEARTSAAQAGRSTQAAMVRIARDGVKQATTPEAKKAMRKDVKRVTDAYRKGNELTYMNGMVDKNVKKKENEVKIRNNAYSKTVGNRVKYERIYKNNKKTVNSGSQIADQYSGILTDEQKNTLKSGKKVDVSGVTDPQALAAINKYNKAVINLKTSQEKYNNTLDAEKEAAANAAQAQTELAQARVEAVQTKIDNTADYYDTRIAFKSAKAEGKEKKIDAYNVRNYARVSDYDVKIGNAKEQQKLTKKKAKDMQDALNAGVKSGAIKVGSKEWLEARTRIEEAKNAAADFDTEIENLQSQKIAAYYEEQFDRIIDKINQTKERLSTINGLISDEMKINKNTGQLTDMGAMSVMLTSQEFSANQEALVKNMEAQEQAKRDRQKNKDAGGKKGVGLTEKEYDERMSKLKSEQNTLLQNGMSLRQEQINLIISQAQAELDVLNKTISKRKEALKAKKDYYDYDKTLKNKTKDIQTIERQIAALEGSTNAEDKARKARLQEQLASAKDSLQDTITDHSYTLQSDSLDQLSTDLQEDFERWENDLRGSIDKMSDAISEALENAGLDNNKIRANLKNLLISVGVPANKVDSVLTVGAVTGSAPAGTTSTSNTSTSNKSKSSKSKKSSSKKSNTSKKSKSKSKKSSTSKKKTTKGYASGTNYVPKSDIYRVNEKGQEIINSKRYGLITYLEKGDSVYPANISEQILAGASTVTNSNLPDFGKMAKGLENTVSNTNVGNNTYISNFYINGSEDPETLMKQIDKHINELIAKNDKKRVRDFKSLH